jgi:hypothetical protein
MGVDWHAANRKLLQIARRLRGNKRGIELAVRACKGQMNRLRSERDLHFPDLYKETVNSYLLEIYVADFADPALLKESYENPSLRQADIEGELDTIRPHINEIIEYYAGQIARTHSVDGLRLPPSKEQPPIDLHDENLLRLSD